MEENNVIFSDGVDAVAYLADQCTKNISDYLFGAIHLIRTYLMTEFWTPLPLHAPVHILDDDCST